MGGTLVSADDLLKKNLELQDERFIRGIGIELLIELIPSLQELAQLIALGKAGIGCGEDVLPHEVFKTLPAEFARLPWPLMLKCATRLQEPIAWKGGVLAELIKKGGTLQKCADHRGILISHSAGKLWRSTVRSNLAVLCDEHP